MANPSYLRLPKESENSYNAFLCYRSMGKTRSLGAVADALKKNRDNIGKLSARWHWVDRARAWDNKVQREIDERIIADEAKWEARRLRAQERMYERSQFLDTKAQAMIDMPIVRKVKEEKYEDGRVKTIVFEPAGWRQRDVAALWDMATELENRSIEMALPKKRQEDRKAIVIADARAEAMLEAAGSLDDDYDPPED